MRVATICVLALVTVGLVTGCVPVCSEQPIGEKPHVLDPDDWDGKLLADDVWVRLRVLDAEKGLLEFEPVEKDEEFKAPLRVAIRESGEWLFASIQLKDWENSQEGMTTKMPETYMWGLMKNEAGLIIIWPPDGEKFQKLVEAGKLPGEVKKEDDGLAVFLKELSPEHLKLITSEEEGVLFEWTKPMVMIREPALSGEAAAEALGETEKAWRKAQTEAESSDIPKPAWTLDTAKMIIPDRKVSGIIHGQTFTPNIITLDYSVEPEIKLIEGDTFDPARSVTITLKPGQVAANKTIVIPAGIVLEDPPTISLEWQRKLDRKKQEERWEELTAQMMAALKKGDEKAANELFRQRDAEMTGDFEESFEKGFAMILQFGKPLEKSLSGRIFLCVPDGNRSFAAGTFNLPLPLVELLQARELAKERQDERRDELHAQVMTARQKGDEEVERKVGAILKAEAARWQEEHTRWRKQWQEEKTRAVAATQLAALDQKWKEASLEVKRQMVDEDIDLDPLWGKSKDDIIAVFGEPSSEYDNDKGEHVIKYDLGAVEGENCYLQFHFKDDKMAGTEYNTP